MIDVSIIITTYNYEQYLLESILSCLFQLNTSLEYEVVVVDDGSTDGTSTLLKGIEMPRLRKFKIQNSGIECAANFGFQNSFGKYIVRVDSDDRLCSNYLATLEKYLPLGNEFLYSNYSIIDAHGVITDEVFLPQFNPEEILGRGDFLATGTLYSRDLLGQYGYYLTDIKNSGLENYQLIIRMLMGGVSGLRIPDPIFCYRRHSSNISKLKISEILKNGERFFNKLGISRGYQINENHPYIKSL